MMIMKISGKNKIKKRYGKGKRKKQRKKITPIIMKLSFAHTSRQVCCM